ncbi:TIGR03842 family LLM class F420-dependent oxidoreductase [Aquipuribacter nitratireducens]|uniref:TIGR03842 family LLM class F420-dependent oxidoreductase n=1 Tax=Aquipuribacter nitratireducens TaxID=650104 RepID=A0ABW0GJM8_9MICO
MDLGLVLQNDPPAWRVVDLLRRAETLGFSHGWTFDSHVLWQEPYVVYSQVLAATHRMVVGPMVTNPGTRDWTVIASLHATLHDMYGERTVCAFGRGDSAMRYIGRSPCTLGEVRDAMHTVKALAEGRTVTYNEREIAFPWRAGGSLPVYMAGYGPKALQTCGEHADGFILQLADPSIVEWTIGAVREAAAAAGRDPDSLYVIVAAPAYVGPEERLPHMRDQVRWFGGMVGNHVADLVGRYGDAGAAVPTALTDYIRGRQGYDYAEHGRAGNTHTDFVPDEVIDRFCLLGPVERHLERLAELRDLGVDQFAVYLMHDEPEATLTAYGERVAPVLRRGT